MRPESSEPASRVTEEPFKIPYYVALLRLLHEEDTKNEDEAPTTPSLGRQILEDFWKGFQAYLDKLAWRETRLCVKYLLVTFCLILLIRLQIHFFAHLTATKLVSPESMISLLQSFTTVLDEFGVSHGRAKQAALCAAEGLMIVRV